MGHKKTQISFEPLRVIARDLEVEELWDEPAEQLIPFMSPIILEMVDADTTGMSVARYLDLLDDDIYGAVARGQAWGLVHAWVWMHVRRRSGSQWPAVEALTPTMSRLELEQWAWRLGLSAALDLPTVLFSQFWETPEPVLYEYLEPRPWYLWRLADVLTRNPLWDAYRVPPEQDRQSLLEVLKGMNSPSHEGYLRTPAKIEAHAQSVQDAGLPESLRRYGHDLVDSLRKQALCGVQGFAGRSSYHAASVKVLDEGRGLGMTAELGCARAPRAVLEVSVRHGHPDIRCTCPGSSRRPCAAKIEALEHFIAKIARSPEQEPQVMRALHHALETPEWMFAVDKLVALVDAPNIPQTMDGVPAWFGWRVEGISENQELKIYPALVRHKKRGDGVITKRFEESEHDDEVLRDLDARDTEIMLMVRAMRARQRSARSYFDPFSSGTWMQSRYDGHREHMQVLAALSGHPRVYFATTSSVPLLIEHVEGKVHIEEMQRGEVQVNLQFGDIIGSPGELRYDLYELEEMEGAMIRSFEEEADRACMSIWSVTERFWKILEHVDQFLADPLPAQAHTPVMERAEALTRMNFVTLSEGLRGERVQVQQSLRVQLSWVRGVLEVALAVAPLEEGPMYAPGEGPALVYARRDGRPIHAQRYMEAEERVAQTLCEALGLTRDTSIDAYIWRVDMGDDAMELLARIEHIAREDDAVRTIWDTRRPSIAGTLDGGNLALRVHTSGRFFEVGGEVTSDAGVIPLEQLLRAARQRQRWVEVEEGQWAQMTEKLQRSLQRVSALVREDDEAQAKIPEVSMLSAPALMQIAEEAGASVTGPPAWTEQRERIEHARAMTPDLPEGFAGELRPYQLEGFRWLARLTMWAPGACLADDMGLGKTVQALALMLRRAGEGPALIIGPTSLGFNWKRETERFAPALRVHLVRASAELDALPTLGDHDVVFLSYDLAARNEQWCMERTWATLVLDEAQAIKNPATQRAQAIHRVESAFALILTGTPLENHTGELWSLMQVSAPGLLGNKAQFQRRFQRPIEQHGDLGARMSLAALISPFVMRRVKGEVARDLPERTDIRIDVELSRPERALYEEMRQAALAAMAQEAEERQRFELLAVITRLRQLSCHPQLVHPHKEVSSSKVSALLDKLTEVREEGHRALVFSQFTSLLELVERELEGQEWRVAKLTGSTSAIQRADLVDAFQAGEYDVFLLSIKAGGVGLNLTAASYVFVLDPWWNPAVEDQATDRAHRIGQTQPVTVCRLVTRETIEEVIYHMHQTKRELLDAVMAGAGTTKALSVEELQAMIAGDFEGLSLPESGDREVAEAEVFEGPENIIPFERSTSLLTGGASAPDVEEGVAPPDVAAMGAALEMYLEEMVDSGELSESSASVYTPRLARLISWVAHSTRMPTDAGALKDAYRAALDAGDVEGAVTTDHKSAGAAAKHLIAALKMVGEL